MNKKEFLKSKATESAKKFNAEVRKATSTAIVAAFSFLIALTWKEVITEYVSRLVTLSQAQGKVLSALIITIICVVGIILTSKLLKVNE